MKKIFIILLLFLTLSPVFASRTVVTRQPISYYPNPYQTNYYNRPYSVRNYRSPYNEDISALEKYVLNRTYVRENDLARLQRLELQAFGSVQQGDFNTRFENVRSAILARPKQSYKTSLLNNLGNYFAGQMTGFTPSINQYDSYGNFQNFEFMPNYGQMYNSGYSSPWGSKYSTRNYGSGSSSSIRILD